MRDVVVIVKLSLAQWAFVASALNELDYTKPVKDMVAWEFPSLRHILLADGALLFICRRGIKVD
jgi:hypothetical protein